MINIVISKMNLKEKTYIKVFYVMNEHLIHIKVLEKKDDTYKSVSVESLGKTTALKLLTEPKDDVHVDPEELIDVYEYMDYAFEKAKSEIIHYVNKSESVELLSFHEIGGKYFALIDDQNTPVHKIWEIGIDASGKFDRISPVPYSHIHVLTELLLPELLQYDKRVVLHVSDNIYLGIMKEGKDVVACIYSVKNNPTDDKNKMIFADGGFAFKETSEGYMRYTEFPEKIEKKIEKSSKTLMNFLIELFERK
ncbi:hypothetical protein CN515_05090 [Bacillus cereus]|uniref:hypothetical protein n=1 Tax=Bacillus cereus TaxID=1396 RepID=UPI000BF73522|nr:hypothetical protein [Bacillus cereus]PES55421.1 hypothetical protein CN515_05090 [Bacillus cereus]